MVSAAALLQNLTVFVNSFGNLINSLVSSSLTCVLFSCNVLLVTLSNSPFLSLFIFLLEIYILFEEDRKIVITILFLTTSFSSVEEVLS